MATTRKAGARKATKKPAKKATKTTAKTAAKKATGKSVAKKPAARKAAKKAADRIASRVARKTGVRKVAAKKAAARKTVSKAATRKAPARKAVKKAGSSQTATRTPAKKPVVAQRATPQQASANRTSASKPGADKARKATGTRKRSAAEASGKPRTITPKQALANTRKLLDAKHEHDRQPQPWQQLDGSHATVPQSGFQSPEAAARAEELHAGESRIPAIQGSISTQDRHHQGKRDKR